jgi:hypothetical protein
MLCRSLRGTCPSIAVRACRPVEDGIGFLFGSTGPRGGRREVVVEAVAKSMARQAGREILRGVLGSILGGKRR